MLRTLAHSANGLRKPGIVFMKQANAEGLVKKYTVIRRPCFMALACPGSNEKHESYCLTNRRVHEVGSPGDREKVGSLILHQTSAVPNSRKEVIISGPERNKLKIQTP